MLYENELPAKLLPFSEINCLSSPMIRVTLGICLTVMALLFSADESSASVCNTDNSLGNSIGIQGCSSAVICYFTNIIGATSQRESIKQDAIKESKKRGLSCSTSSPIKKAIIAPPSPLKRSFIVISKDQRKLVQSNLAQENLYTSTVDGLYGKGTEAALKAYNKEYLGNTDLSKAPNAKALIADLLKEKPNVAGTSAAVVVAEVELDKPKIVEPVPAPPLDFAQVKASYDANEFPKAFTDAQVLAVQADPNAQLYLGKMYADGRGTIQVSTAAHMWFNIASMSGNDEAYEQRKALTALMTPSAVEKAQAMAMTCIQSVYTDCGLTAQPVANKAELIAKAVTAVGSLKSYFKEQSLLRRKQIQYALKKLGLYSSSVDGAWGNGTATAVSNYQNLQEMQTASPSELYDSLLSKVDVPSSFSAPKITVATKETAPKPQAAKKPFYPDGWRPFSANPQYSFEQAAAICEPRGQSAGDAAVDRATGFSCNSYGSTTNCGERVPSSIAEMLLTGVFNNIQRGTEQNRVMTSCMAQYGWKRL